MSHTKGAILERFLCSSWYSSINLSRKIIQVKGYFERLLHLPETSRLEVPARRLLGHSHVTSAFFRRVLVDDNIIMILCKGQVEGVKLIMVKSTRWTHLVNDDVELINHLLIKLIINAKSLVPDNKVRSWCWLEHKMQPRPLSGSLRSSQI